MKIPNAKQKEAIEELGNVLVNASPGSGKTFTLVQRAKCKLEKLPKHQQLALITYTNVAADEIAARLDVRENVFIGTIHRFCLEFILKPFAWLYKWQSPKIITTEQKKNFLQSILLKIADGKDADIEQLDNIRKNLDGSFQNQTKWKNNQSLNDVATKYYNYLEENNLIDFNEILFRSYKIINEHEFVRISLASKFYEILVDEFQDTTIFQYEMFKLIFQTGSCSFFMVGDEKQKILSFAGAIDDSFENAKNDFNTGKIIVLNEVHRSTNNIVKAYSSLMFEHPELDNSKSEYKSLNIQVIKKQTTKDNKFIVLENAVNYLIKNNIKQEDIAVLSPRWRDSYELGNKLLRKGFNLVGYGSLPHKRGLISFDYLLKALCCFYCQRSIKNLRSLQRNIEVYLLENSIRIEKRQISFLLNSLINDFFEIDKNIDIFSGFNELEIIFDKNFGFEHPDFQVVAKNLREKSNAESWEKIDTDIWTLDKYITCFTNQNGIFNNTLHSAKGLEFDAVILFEMNKGRIPYQEYDKKAWSYVPYTEEEKEDGRKLFYVGLSRPKKHLIVLYDGGKKSIFIDSINITVAE
jgi:superfamily I DNA/RNA helicase